MSMLDVAIKKGQDNTSREQVIAGGDFTPNTIRTQNKEIAGAFNDEKSYAYGSEQVFGEKKEVQR